MARLVVAATPRCIVVMGIFQHRIVVEFVKVGRRSTGRPSLSSGTSRHRGFRGRLPIRHAGDRSADRQQVRRCSRACPPTKFPHGLTAAEPFGGQCARVRLRVGWPFRTGRPRRRRPGRGMTPGCPGRSPTPARPQAHAMIWAYDGFATITPSRSRTTVSYSGRGIRTATTVVVQLAAVAADRGWSGHCGPW